MAQPSDPAMPDLVAPWRVLHTVRDVLPQEGLALWAEVGSTWSVWSGDPRMPNLQLLEVAHTNPTSQPARLALGITPRQLSLYPLASGRMQLLWLDQTLPGSFQLVGGTLAADQTLERGPTTISRQPVLDYSAIPTPTGSVLAVWTAYASDPTAPTPVYAQIVDGLGRPYSAVRLSTSGRFPSAAYDLKGNLHIAWLESDAGYVWTLHYRMFPARTDPSADNPSNSTIGVVKLGADQALESLVLGVDSANVYCLWDTIQVQTTVASTTVTSTTTGLAFPIGNSGAVHSLTLTIPGDAGLTLRWPVVTARPSAILHVSFTGLTKSSDASVPVIAVLTAQGISAAEPLINLADKPNKPLVGKTALAIDPAGQLYLAWETLQEDGKAEIIYATNRP